MRTGEKPASLSEYGSWPCGLAAIPFALITVATPAPANRHRISEWKFALSPGNSEVHSARLFGWGFHQTGLLLACLLTLCAAIAAHTRPHQRLSYL